MKNTYLIYKDTNAEKKELIVATKEQWDQVLKTNRTLPREQRRFFICDSFEDCGEIDRMFIETQKKEYDKWHSKHELSERNRKCGNQYEFVSTSQAIPRTELTYEDIIAADYDLERSAHEEMVIDKLTQELSAWKYWAVEMMDLYLCGLKKEATSILSEKYGVSERAVQLWKEMFKEYVVKFFEKN